MKLTARFIIILFLFCSCSKTEIDDFQNNSSNQNSSLRNFNKFGRSLESTSPLYFGDPYTETAVKNKVKELIALVGSVDLDDVKEQSSLINDLGFDNIAIVDLERELRHKFNTSELTLSGSGGSVTVENVIRDVVKYVVPSQEGNSIDKFLYLSTTHIDYLFDNLEGFPISLKYSATNAIGINFQFISYEIPWTNRLIGVKASRVSGSGGSLITVGNMEYEIYFSLSNKQGDLSFRSNTEVIFQAEISVSINVIDKSTNKISKIDTKNRKLNVNLTYDVETGLLVTDISLPPGVGGGVSSPNLTTQNIVREIFADKIDLTSRSLSAYQIVSELDLGQMYFTELEWTEFIMALENEFDIEINDGDAENLTMGTYGNLVNYVLRKVGY